MYALVLMDDIYKYPVSDLINPSQLLVLVLDNDKMIEKRLVYPFKEIDLSKDCEYTPTNQINHNWKLAINNMRKDIHPNTEFIFPNKRQAVDFEYMGKRWIGNYFTGGYYGLQNSRSIHEEVIKQNLTGAGNLHEMFKWFKTIDFEELVNDNNQEKRHIDSSKQYTQGSASKIGVAGTCGTMAKKLQKISRKFSLDFVSVDDVTFRVLTLTGDWTMKLTQRPVILCRNLNNGSKIKQIVKTEFYSPIDALLYIRKEELRLLEAKEAEINTVMEEFYGYTCMD